MQVSERNIDDITVIDLSGHLIYEEGFEALRETFNRLIGQGRTRLLLNMAQVSSLDSSGVGLIACKYVTLSRHGGQLKLCNLHPRSHHVLEITKLLTIFESFESEAAALASFR